MKRWLLRAVRRGRQQAAAGLPMGDGTRACLHSFAVVHCEFFALLAAEQRGSDALGLPDMLAGIYIASIEFPSLLRYWEGWPSFERLVVDVCGRLNPRLWYWWRWSSRVDRRPRALSRLSFESKRICPELATMWRLAEHFALHRQHAAGAVPAIAPEDLLMAMISLPDCPLSGKLLESGLDVGRLRRVVEGAEQGALA